jgi:mRNA interferase YafQ
MFQLFYTSRFRKDVKLLQKRGYDMNILKHVIHILEDTGELPLEFKPHKLSGSYTGYWEAHLRPDWLILWTTLSEEKSIWLTRTGTHSDIF